MGEVEGDIFIPKDACDFALFLRDRRQAEGHQQWDVADALDAWQSMVSDWESCTGEPVLSNSMMWANALGFRVALIPFEVSVENETFKGNNIGCDAGAGRDAAGVWPR